MPWQPNPQLPQAEFEGPILQNCLTVLTRDFKEALDYHFLDSPTYLTRYGVANNVGASGADLDDFQERSLGPPLRNVFPCLGVEPVTNKVTEADDGSHFLEVARVQLNLAVTADGPDAVTILIMKYVAMVTRVLTQARWELVEGLSNPFGVILVDFDHLYDRTRETNSVITRAAAVIMGIGFREG